MKLARIESELPEMRGQNQFAVSGTGTTTKSAISRAIGNLLKHHEVKGKHLTRFNLSVYVSNCTETE